MKSKLIGVFVCMLFLTTALFPLIGSSKHVRIVIQNRKQNDNIKWVLMFYQNGDNKLSNYIDICLDLIEKVGATDDVKIAVLIDKNKINDTKLYYYDGVSKLEQDWPLESDMSDPDTLVQFAEKVMNDFPSDHYCLEITANKGSGWQGICYDQNSDGIMITMPELYDALSTITDNGCFKLDVLLIQTCLGGNLEFRYQVRQFCNYYVSYADCGLVGDIPFDSILADLVANPSMSDEQLAITVVSHFTPQHIEDIYQAMGATDSTKLDDLSISINKLAVWLNENISTYKNDIQNALEETRKYGLQFDIDYYVDLKDFLEHLTIDNSDYLNIKNTVLINIEETVIAKVTLFGYPSCGFNFYFPNKKDDYNNALRYDHALPSPYEETLFALDTKWDDFLKTFLDLSNNSPPNIPSIDGLSKGKPNEEYKYKLSADDLQGDKVCFYIDWNDDIKEWTNFVSSGEENTFSHTWDTKGNYEIKVKSIDQYGAWSDWGTFKVTITRNRAITCNSIIIKVLKHFPILARILNL